MNERTIILRKRRNSRWGKPLNSNISCSSCCIGCVVFWVGLVVLCGIVGAMIQMGKGNAKSSAASRQPQSSQEQQGRAGAQSVPRSTRIGDSGTLPAQ